MSRVQWLGEVNCFDKCGWKPGEPDPTGTKALCVKGCLGQTAQQWPTQQTAQSLQPTSAPSQVTAFPVPDPGCLTDCENKWGISGGNWNAVELAKCIAACKGQAPATPAPPQVVTPPPGGSTPAPSGGGGSTPAPGGGISNTSEEKKTPWGWIILGGAALIGGAYVLLRGAGELGGAMASNPSNLERARTIALKVHGEKMQHWHSSGSDPIYAVGSYHASGKLHPSQDTVAAAERALWGILEKGRYTQADRNELHRLIRDMHKFYPSWLSGASSGYSFVGGGMVERKLWGDK